MLEFREINIDDRDWINKLLKKSDFISTKRHKTKIKNNKINNKNFFNIITLYF